MANIKLAYQFNHLGIAPIDPERQFNRGTGRRLPQDKKTLAAIPLTVKLGDTKATHELMLVAKSYNGSVTARCGKETTGWKKSYNEDVRTTDEFESIACILGNAACGRGPGSKLLRMHDGTWYAFMTWHDLFGYSIKECGLDYSKAGTTRNILKPLDAAQTKEAEDALNDLLERQGVTSMAAGI